MVNLEKLEKGRMYTVRYKERTRRRSTDYQSSIQSMDGACYLGKMDSGWHLFMRYGHGLYFKVMEDELNIRDNKYKLVDISK